MLRLPPETSRCRSSRGRPRSVLPPNPRPSRRSSPRQRRASVLCVSRLAALGAHQRCDATMRLDFVVLPSPSEPRRPRCSTHSSPSCRRQHRHEHERGKQSSIAGEMSEIKVHAAHIALSTLSLPPQPPNLLPHANIRQDPIHQQTRALEQITPAAVVGAGVEIDASRAEQLLAHPR